MKSRLQLSASRPLLACLLFLWAGCGGERSSYSIKDTAYFAESPIIVIQDNHYSLTWKYDSMGYFFEPSSKVVNGQLHFSLQGTSSSGNLAWKYKVLPITDSKQVKALETGGAFWLEPSETNVPLEIKRL